MTLVYRGGIIKKGMKKLVISMLLAGSLLCLAVLAEAAPVVGSTAPGLELSNLEGNIVSLYSYQSKKPVILFFFTSWSKSCQSELADLRETYKSTNCEILAVSFDKKQKELRSFISKEKIPFPVLVDKNLSLLDKFQVLILPTTFCIGRDGVIEKIFVDYDDNVKKAVSAWLRS